MHLIGQKFKSKFLGVGLVVEQGKDDLIISFPSKISKFEYKEITFTKFLKAEDLEIQAALLKEFEDEKEAKKQQELLEAMIKQQEEEARQKALAEQQASTKKPATKKSIQKQERIPENG